MSDSDRTPDGPGRAPTPGPDRRSGVDRSAAVRDHLANERTLLAWQRTALAMIGLGFVVDRFAFEGTPERSLAGTLLGLGLIMAGALAAAAGVQRFIHTEREIDTDSYQPSMGIHVLFTGLIVAGALGLVLYLLLAGPG